MPGLSVQPFLTSNAAGSFQLDTAGYIQGFTQDNPSVRNFMESGVVGLTEASPMFGGMAINETIPTGLVSGSTAGPKAMGGTITRATTPALITGFTVFDQAHHMVSTVQNPVPMALQGTSVHFYRLGTRARIAVACDPALASLMGGTIGPQVSWDFTGQRLVPYEAAFASVAVSSAAYNSTTGQITFTSGSSHGLVPGNDFSVTGMLPAGFNGSYTALSGTTGSTLVAAANTPVPTASSSTQAGSLAAGGGALVGVTLLDVAAANCMQISIDPATGYATWNRNGSCALILI